MNLNTITFEDCREMMSILQHPDVQECFSSASVQRQMQTKGIQAIPEMLRDEECIQRLLTNPELVQRISAMHVKMHVKMHDSHT